MISFKDVYLRVTMNLKDKTEIGYLRNEIYCQLYYPPIRDICPCTLKIIPDNAKFISNHFLKVRDKLNDT